MSLAEVLVAAAILLSLTAAVTTVTGRAQATFRVQPELADMQQRLRVAAALIGRDGLMAGAGPATSALAGPLVLRFPPMAPYRRGLSDDGARGVFYRPDALSLVYVPATRAEATITRADDAGAEVRLDLAPNCGSAVHERVCGFTVGMRVLLFDGRGAYDVGTVTGTAGDSLHVAHDGPLATSDHGDPAVVAEVVAATYFVKADAATGAFQLMRYDGFKTDSPVIDNVVEFRADYFGDPQPPRLLPPARAGDPVRPATSYAPAPPAPGVDDVRDTWGPGENCAFADRAGSQVSRLAVLGPGLSPVLIPPAVFQDGPWCPDAAHAVHFDANLLRVRRVRLALRVQVAVAAMRGPAGPLFSRGGAARSAEYFAPDQRLVFDVTPRNLGGTP